MSKKQNRLVAIPPSSTPLTYLLNGQTSINEQLFEIDSNFLNFVRPIGEELRRRFHDLPFSGGVTSYINRGRKKAPPLAEQLLQQKTTFSTPISNDLMGLKTRKMGRYPSPPPANAPDIYCRKRNISLGYKLYVFDIG